MLSFSAPTQDRSKKVLERFLNVAAGRLANNKFEGTGCRSWPRCPTLQSESSQSESSIACLATGMCHFLPYMSVFEPASHDNRHGCFIVRNRNSCSDNVSADSRPWQAGCRCLRMEAPAVTGHGS